MALPDQKIRSPKDPITCHVLDITTGLPAASMLVKLRIGTRIPQLENDLYHPFFQAKTNTDGRITHWDSDDGNSLEELISLYGMAQQRTVWVLTFDTEKYFGDGKGFFPEVEVRFYVNNAKGSHVHVPLLIGPYSYTTYRGS